MSLRMIGRLYKNGRILLQNIYNRNNKTNILENLIKTNENFPTSTGNRRSLQQFVRTDGFHIKNVGVLFSSHARKIFVDNVLNRVTNSLAADLRRRAARRLLFGDSRPFFALIGVSLASGSGLLTKDDELEGVCWEIREAISKVQWYDPDSHQKPLETENVTLSDLTIGPPIAKGCSAVVYAAKYNHPVDENAQVQSGPVLSAGTAKIEPDTVHKRRSPFRNLSYSNNRLSSSAFCSSTPNLTFDQYRRNSTAALDERNVTKVERKEPFTEIQILPNVVHGFEIPTEDEIQGTSDAQSNNFRFNLFSAFSSLASSVGSEIHCATSADSTEYVSDDEESHKFAEFPIALKMMFNYDIQSCAATILKAMQRETLPARRKCQELDSGMQLTTLPPHPNIVLMYSVFADTIPALPQASKLYPSALPQRINPQGYGRNMSLFLLMKRYDSSLQQFLSGRGSTLSPRESLVLLAQLLEAVTHLSQHGIAHRDLKSDNILLEFGEDGVSPPTLVISDFGCCLADPHCGLLLPYNSNEIDKGGNTALMAPEIITQTPGTFSVLNYTKSDLWAVGTLAYEIYGIRNPFYGLPGDPNTLRNVDYDEDALPAMPAGTQPIIKQLVANLLQRNPNKRLCPAQAATVTQLLLWAPSTWLKGCPMPSSAEILQWLLCLTTKVLCEARLASNVSQPAAMSSDSNPKTSSQQYSFNNNGTGRRTLPEYILISSFLARAKLREIKKTLEWIHGLDV